MRVRLEWLCQWAKESSENPANVADPYTQGSGIRLGELHPGNPISILCLFFTGITRLVLKNRLKGGRGGCRLGLELEMVGGKYKGEGKGKARDRSLRIR